MKHTITEVLKAAIFKLQEEKILPKDLPVAIQLERARDEGHGDYASNIALLIAKAAGMKPRELAEKIVAACPKAPMIEGITIGGPGFINFILSSKALHDVVPNILREGDDFGRSDYGQGQRINIEYISANPTGPLHVGHGRGAAYGSTIANLLAAIGFIVHQEYYVNDAGRQMDILAVSIWLRYLELLGQHFAFPSNGYKGDYVKTIANDLKTSVGLSLYRDTGELFSNIPPDATLDGEGDKESHIDGLIAKAKVLLGKDYETVFQQGLTTILADIREDCRAFGVEFDEWFSESSLVTSNAISLAIHKLQQNGHTYEREGALWFHSIPLGDDKDRVLIRENGQTTYFASDIAYLLNKFERGFDCAIYIFGADHHGYIPRLKAAAKALNIEPEKVVIILVQFAVLYRGEEKVQMSTRSGSFVTLKELREDVGKDAARFFYVMRKNEQHMDFDLDLAKSQSNENPVYYIQYAHARICSIFKQLREKNLLLDTKLGLDNMNLLENDHEKALFANLSRYPEIVLNAGKKYEPLLITNYLREIANDLHAYYNSYQFLVSDDKLRNARLVLIQAVQHVLKNGLRLLGLKAPEQM